MSTNNADAEVCVAVEYQVDAKDSTRTFSIDKADKDPPQQTWVTSASGSVSAGCAIAYHPMRRATLVGNAPSPIHGFENRKQILGIASAAARFAIQSHHLAHLEGRPSPP